MSDQQTLELLIKAKQQTDAAFAAVVRQVEALGAKTKQASGSSKLLSAAGGELKTVLGGLSGPAGTLGSVLSAIGPAGLIAAAGLGATVGAAVTLGQWAMDFAKRADDLQNLTVQTGLSAEAFQEWAFAAKDVGGSQEMITSMSGRLTRALAEGGDEARVAIAGLGLSFDDLASSSEDAQLAATVKGLHDLADKGRQATIAYQLFGKDARVLRLVRKDTDDLREAAHKYNAVFEGETLAAAADANTKIERLSGTWQSLKDSIAQGVATSPDAAKAIDDLALSVASLGVTIGQHSPQILDLFRLLGSFSGVAPILSGLSGASAPLPGEDALARTKAGAGAPAGAAAGTQGAGDKKAGDPGYLKAVADAQNGLSKAKLAMLPLLDRENGALLQQVRALELDTAQQVRAIQENKALDDATRKRITGILWATKAATEKAIREADAQQKQEEAARAQLQGDQELAAVQDSLASSYDQAINAITRELAARQQEILYAKGLSPELKKERSDREQTIAAGKIAAVVRQQESQEILESVAATRALGEELGKNETAYVREAKAIEEDLAQARLKIQLDTSLADATRKRRLDEEEAMAAARRYNLQWDQSTGGVVKTLQDQAVEYNRNATALAYLEANKDQIIETMVREGMSVDKATEAYKKQKKQLEENLGRIDYMAGLMQALPSIIGQVGSAMEEMGYTGAQAWADIANSAIAAGKSIASGDIAGTIINSFKTGWDLSKALFGPDEEAEMLASAAGMGLEAADSFWEQFKPQDNLFAAYYLNILEALESEGLPAASLAGEDLGLVFQQSFVRGAEGLANIQDVMGALEDEMGRGVPGALEALDQSLDLVFQQMDTGQMSATTGADLLGQAFDSLRAAAEDGIGGAADEMRELIAQARAAGVEVEGINTYIRDLQSSAGEDLTAIFGEMTADGIKGGIALGYEDEAALFAQDFRAILAEQGLPAAVEEMGGAWAAIQGEMATLTQEQRDALLGDIPQLMGLVSEKTLPIFNAIQATGRTVERAGTTGYTTEAGFAAAQSAALAEYGQLIEAGATPEAAMEAMGPLLAQFIEQAAAGSLPIAEGIQALIAESDMVPLQDATERSASVLESQIAPSLAQMVAIMSGGGGGPTGAELVPLASGGIVQQNLAALVHGGEVVSPLSDLAGMIESAMVSAMARGGRGGESTTTVPLEVGGASIGRLMIREVMSNGELQRAISFIPSQV